MIGTAFFSSYGKARLMLKEKQRIRDSAQLPGPI
jgi:hypothetical protein